MWRSTKQSMNRLSSFTNIAAAVAGVDLFLIISLAKLWNTILADSERLCPCCGETRQRIGCETSEQLEFVPAVLKVIEHRRWKYACRRCAEQVAIALVPNKPIAKGLPGPGLLSSVVVSKYADHLPLYRLEDVLARSGVDLSRSTLCRWVMQTAAVLEPVYQAMVERVRSSESIHTDDTPVSVLDASLAQDANGAILGLLRRLAESLHSL